MKVRAILAVLAAIGLLSACTLGPDPARPANPAEGLERYLSWTETPDEPVDPLQWWHELHDPYLDLCIEEALANNQDLAASAARVLQARASLEAVRGNRLPQADISVDASRQKFSFVLPGIGRTGIYSTTFSDSLDVSYQVDLFGRLLRTRQAAWAEYLEGRAERRALLHTIIADIVTARISGAAMREQAAIAKQIASRKEMIASLVRQRYDGGISDASRLKEALSMAADARSRAEELSSSADKARWSLDTLTGRPPGDDPLPLFPWESASSLPPVPPGLPASLLDRRPDLLASQMRAEAATAREGISIANLLPSLSLTGSIGIQADEPADLASTAGMVYGAIGRFLAPIFQGGRLRAEVRRARARAREAAAKYASDVLGAIEEVEAAMRDERAAVLRLSEAERRARLARERAQIMEDRYEAGLVSLQDYLQAGLESAERRMSLLDAGAERLRARVRLYLALGGSWSATEDGSLTQADNRISTTGAEYE